ncbi:hypothetical protein PRZ48_002133 [Zasmidium cellare]|uniref:Phosphoglycerate mutase-like protein n=1 Tax=Zasmidium cellare TaxID=395010 RepID=A0ABR0F544_ZASCE|nr:hypothetical protein PRZ48_002133 [Zasmidium cellare]
MTPTIHCVRHAQGYHNLTTANHHMHDPLLTPYGEQQCRDLQTVFPNQSSIDLIVASPIKRTLNTALLSFADIIASKNLTVIALPELQETSDLPCDTGSEPEELRREFEGKAVDLELVKEGWNGKRGKWAPNGRAIEKRAREARVWLQNRTERNIVVVTHGGFLHYFTEDFHDQDRFAGTGWANTEFRSYAFSTHEPEEAHLIETQESRERRKGDRKGLDSEEHVNLQRTGTEEGKIQAKV